jgi:hypothetical protein
MTVQYALPGVSFKLEPPRLDTPLPRMDVGAFVGFAERGPLDTPVVVEDPTRFAEIFGVAPRLAWDPSTGSWQTAGLAAAVRDFFAQGGRRCWVVRVAGPTAASNIFPLAGVLAAEQDGVRPAFARARSAGSWSDDLHVRAGLLIEPLGEAQMPATVEPGAVLAVDLLAAPPIGPGDLLLLEVQSWQGFLAVEHVMRSARQQTVSGRVNWLRAFQASETVTGIVRDESAGGTGGKVATLRYDEAGRLRLTTAPWTAAESPADGAWLTLQPNGQYDRLWLLFDGLEVDGARLGGAWREARPASYDVAGIAVRAARLTLTLQVRSETAPPAEIADLGLAAGHPRFWAGLPDDEALFASPDGQPEPAAPSPTAALTAEARAPRFPLAGPVDATGAYLPLGLLVGFDGWSGRHGRPARPDLAPVRDGLVPPGDRSGGQTVAAWLAALAARSDNDWLVHLRGLTSAAWAAFTADVMLDPALEMVGEAVLLEDASDRLLVRQQPLRGLHALLPIEEVSLLALPDAAQRGWSLVEGQMPPTPSVPTAPDPPPPCPGHDLFVDCVEPTPPIAPTAPPARRLTPPRARPELLTDAYVPDGLLRVQRAAARLAAARADLVAVLGLPGHYRASETLEHRQMLRRLLGQDGEKAASYVALYHPWITVREADGSLRRSGPEGAACGAIAARTLDRGAWVAPANQVVRNAIDIAPQPSAADLAALYAESVNMLAPGARGFVLVSAATLSDDSDLRPLNIRRLLIVLRRLALREGRAYVFAPHSPTFRRRVQTGFERHLAGMFALGAFAGTDPTSAYQVLVDDTVNTPPSVEQGRFVVELRVAPSQPLAFIVVRLIQSAPGSVAVQEV